MGYYTRFQVTWDKHEDETIEGVPYESIDQAIEKKFNEITGIDEETFGCDYDVWDASNDYTVTFYAKWYDWKKDMNELSRAYPDMIFRVSGAGEEYEDLWKSIWKDGCYEIQYAEIPPFTGEMKEYKNDDLFSY